MFLLFEYCFQVCSAAGVGSIMMCNNMPSREAPKVVAVLPSMIICKGREFDSLQRQLIGCLFLI